MDYDVIVLGGGAAGLGAARSAVAAGVRTLLVTEGPPGGDCTFTGCVPSKTLIEAVADGLPFEKAMARVRTTVATIAATEDETALLGEGIEVMRGRARFTAADRVAVNGTELAASRFVIATGATPSVPPIAGLVTTPLLTTDTVFDLADAPESLVVLGAGAVGCELAQAFARLGVRVSLIEASDRILPGEDPDVSSVLTDVLRTDGVAVQAGVEVTAVEQQQDRMVLHTRDAPLSGQRLLVATGRSPATHDLGPDAAGVDVDDGGFVVVDKHLATSSPGIVAAGDVTGCSATPMPHTRWAGSPPHPRCAAGDVRRFAPTRYPAWCSPIRRSPASACRNTRPPAPAPGSPTCRCPKWTEPSSPTPRRGS